MSKKVSKKLDEKLTGGEPAIDEVMGRNDPRLPRIFNTYNYLYDDKKSHSWLLQWMKQQKMPKSKVDAVRDAPSWAAGTTAGWVARLHMNGTKFPKENLDYVREKIDEVLKKFPKRRAKEEKEPTRGSDLQARIRARADAIMSSAEEEVVDGHYLDPKKAIGMYDFLSREGVSTQVAGQMRSRYVKVRDELYESDPQVKEAFGRGLRQEQKFWDGVIDDLDRYLNNKRVVRVKKPRIPKARPASKIVERLNYMKEHPDLKLVSVDPQNLLGCRQLWVYDTKSRILTRYDASGPEGLGVKGTTLTGYDLVSSMGKRLRKPELTLKEVLSAGKVAIRRVLSDLKTVDIKPNGRINKNVVLLRVLR